MHMRTRGQCDKFTILSSLLVVVCVAIDEFSPLVLHYPEYHGLRLPVCC